MPEPPGTTPETWRASGGETLYAFAWDYDAVGNRTYQSEIGVNGRTAESPVERRELDMGVTGIPGIRDHPFWPWRVWAWAPGEL